MPDINDYIENTRKAGHSDAGIKEELRKAGWTDKDIKPAFANKTNTLAIVAIFLAVLLPPVGMILGIISLVQISRRKEGGIAFSIIAIIVGALLSLVLVFSVL